MKTEIHSLTAEDIKKVSENLQQVSERSEEAQEIFDTLFNYFSHMILNSDFIKVVRCKDCWHYVPRLGYCKIHTGYISENSFSPDDFCSFAETKKQGRWITNKYDVECSVCHKLSYANRKYDYCPNCGADMRGKEE